MKPPRQKLSPVFPLVLVLLIPASLRGQTNFGIGAAYYDGPGDHNDGATALVVDSDNNAIVTGYSEGSVGTGIEYATVKYSNIGVPLWTNRYSGAGNTVSSATGVAVDGSNHVIVTGYSRGGTGYYDYATVEYSSAGMPLWTNRYSGEGLYGSGATALAVDTSNNVIVTGYSDGGGSTFDYATVAYSSGGVPLWTNRYNGPGNGVDRATGLAVDGSNNVIVTGYSYGGSEAKPDYATIKYSSEGVPLWTNLYNGSANRDDQAQAVAVDGDNNIIVTGYSIEDAGYTNLVTNALTIKYSSEGVPIWTNGYVGPAARGEFPCGVSVDSSNGIIVSGFSGSSPLPYNYSHDYVTIKYSSAGVPLWTNRYNGAGNWDDRATGLAIDGSNNVIVTGYSVYYGGRYNYLTIWYSAAGVPLWTNLFTAQGGNDYPSAVTVDHSGNVLVTGRAWRGSYQGNGDDFATVRYFLSAPILTALESTASADRMRVDEVKYPSKLVIETSTNLATWVPLVTNFMWTNVLFYTNSDVAADEQFYRAIRSP